MAEGPLALAAKLKAALDLFETGVALMRQNLRRAHPEASEREIDERLARWVHERPGAQAGDCEGRVVQLAERRR